MAKAPRKEKQEETKTVPIMPFNEALKRVWSAPPQHKIAKKSKKKKST